VYASTDGCFLDRTLDRRTGLPITLSGIYLEVGWRIGLPLAGVGMPGHFIIRHEGVEATFFDPFTGGRAFHASECEAVLGRRLGAGFTVHPEYLASVGRAAILYRMLNNRKGMYLRSRKLDLALWATDRMLIVRPDSMSDRRNRGLLYAATQNHTRACSDFEAYLSHVPSLPDAPLVLSQLHVARSQSGWLN
jgi:regulator of sirC expression with transglutaminase-like and TPR domain